MQQSKKNQFGTRWAIVIYIVSVLEAIGLSIYFRASIPDPEMASMQAQYVEAEQVPASAAGSPACHDCLLLARSPHAAPLKR